MTFRETLDAHLRAIQQRDLQGLIDTLPAENLTLIMSDGRLVRSVQEFVKLHQGWFESKSWTLGTEIVSLYETPDLGLATLHIDYRDTPPAGTPIHETSHLTLAFARLGDRWVMIHDQNTPIKQLAG